MPIALYFAEDKQMKLTKFVVAAVSGVHAGFRGAANYVEIARYW
jgi:hypothetical protein